MTPKYFNQSTNCEVQHSYTLQIISEIMCPMFFLPRWQALH